MTVRRVSNDYAGADGDVTDLTVDTATGRLRVDGGSAAVTTGAVDDAAVVDPADNGTVIALLKGILTALNSIDAKTPAV